MESFQTFHAFIYAFQIRLGVLSQDGACKCFDTAGDGYARSEAICAIVLERAKDARRIYGTVVHAKTNCDGYKPEGNLAVPSVSLKTILKRFRYHLPFRGDAANLAGGVLRGVQRRSFVADVFGGSRHRDESG